MKGLVKAISTISLAALVAMPVMADEPFEKEIEARKAHMQVVKYNMGILGAMAKGKREYNAELADAVAKNLYSAAAMNNMTMWPKGSDNSVEGLEELTKSKPEMWADDSEVGDKHMAWVKASENMSTAAGQDLGSLKKAMGPLGKSCKGCHKAYKAK